ncbi:MAG: S8 family peptidase [Oceanococcus sp.]
MLRFSSALRQRVLLGLAVFLFCGQALAGPGLQAILASNIPANEQVRAVAMFEEAPSTEQLSALQALGLQAQGLKHLPMALSKGSVAQLSQAVQSGIVKDVYIDQRLKWHSAESTAAMSADVTRELGFDGAGVTVAVVDSGIDASHPDLENRVVRNVRVYSPEYLDILGVSEPLGISWPSEPALVLPFDDLPYNNTDTIGHGTHVAGIVAGEGVGDGSLVGVAPGADIVGYSTGEILFIFTALASFDDILDTHDEYNIRVVNNSWGSSYRMFNPNDPITVGTKALHDAGITVVFSAGNDGLEMTTNVHSQAPWVIMSGSATVSGEKSDFSSSGLKFDNSTAQEIGDDRHLRHEGDGLGLSHPDASAPGSSIVSTCTPTGAIVCGATLPGGSANASGTSMSSPHMAGLAAVLLQANPDLTPGQIRQVMQTSAKPMKDGAAVWQSGFGFVDAKLAVDLVLRSDFSQGLLDSLETAAEAAALAARDYSVVTLDQWDFTELLFTVAGLETHDFPFDVAADVDAIRAGIAFPADLGIVGLNLLFEWTLNLIDPAGNVVASSELLPDLGIGILHADLAALGITDTAGTWTLQAVGETHVAQPGLLWGHVVTLTAAQLISQSPAGVPQAEFVALDEISFSFSGGSGQGLSSPEACDYDLLGVEAIMVQGEPDSICHAGTVGYLVNYGLSEPARFISEPISDATTLGGLAMLRIYLADTLETIYGLAFGSTLTYQLDAVDDAGQVLTPIAAGEVPSSELQVGSTATIGVHPLSIPATDLPAGSRIRLQMQFSGVYTSTMRLLWAGEFADAGLTLQTGEVVIPGEERQSPLTAVAPTSISEPSVRGGSVGLSLLLILALGSRFRRRRLA